MSSVQSVAKPEATTQAVVQGDGNKPAVAPKPAAAPAAAPSGTPASAQPPASTAAEIARQVRHHRARRLARALGIWVGIPTLLGILYFGFIARDQYESVTTIVMRGNDGQAGQHAVMLREYMLSRDMLTALDRKVQFAKHFKSGSDPLSTLPSSAGSERTYTFFRSHVDAHYDAHNRVFSLRVRAFSGTAARSFATAMLDLGRDFLMQVEPSRAPNLIVVAQPSAPNESTYPRRGYGMITVFFASLALFGIGSLLIAAVREHAQF